MKHVAGVVLEKRSAEEDGPDVRPLDFKLIRRVFAYARPHRRVLNQLILTVTLRAIQLPLMAWMIGALINGPIASGDLGGLVLGTVGFAAFALFTQYTFHYRQLRALQFGEAVMHDMRTHIYSHLLAQRMAFFNRTSLGRIISRVTSDLESVRTGVQNVIFVSMVQLGQMVVAGVLMLWYDWILFLLIVAVAPIIWALNNHFRKKLSKAYRDSQESFSRITATLAESVNGIRITQSFVRQDLNAEFFKTLVADHSRYNMGAARTTAVFLPLLELNSQFFIAGLLLLGGYRALNPEIAMPLGDLIQFFFLANLFFDPIKTLGNQYNQALTAMAGAERVFHLLDSKADWDDPTDAAPAPRFRGEVQFRDVGFAYNPGTPVLHDINFVAHPGEVIALVGHTGSGKSSIINLLAKFYQPTSGSILIDGTDIARLQTPTVSRQLGIVLQQNFLFTGTVMDNIRLGRPDASDAEVIAAAQRLGALDLLEALPQGFWTVVGERGSGLSVGQRQLVCFARALLADPRILILDEATSSIDTITEARCQEALSKLLADRTSFVVAHRLSTITHANCVLVLDQGRIIERGAHSELLAKGGAYAGLYRDFVTATTA